MTFPSRDLRLPHRFEQRGEELPLADFAARYTYEAVEAVAQKLKSALTDNKGNGLVISGGVAANSHLRHRLTELTKTLGAEIFIPDRELCADNAAMIGAAGYFEYERGNFADSSLNASAFDTVI